MLMIENKVFEEKNSSQECAANESHLYSDIRETAIKGQISPIQFDAVTMNSCFSFVRVSSEWLYLRKPDLKASSYAKYVNQLKSYLLPSFGNVDIRKITRVQIQQFSREMLSDGGTSGKGLSSKTVASIISMLKSILNYAKNDKGINTTDINGISVRQQQRPMRVLSIAEQSRLTDYLCNNPNPCNIGIIISMYTGIRIGELCALQWRDIILEDQCLFVHKSMQRIQLIDNDVKKTKIVIQTPKSNCSIRKIPIPHQLLCLLLHFKKDEDAFLLTGEVDKYMEPRTLENRFKRIVDTCGISSVSFHTLRHTFATRCVEVGFDIKCLSEILGHANVNITLNRYVHPSMDLKKENMNRLSSLLSL